MLKKGFFPKEVETRTPLLRWIQMAGMRFPNHPSRASDWDSFFECPPDCDARPLNNVDILSIAGMLARGMARRPCSADERRGHVQRGWQRESGLGGFVLHGFHLANFTSEVARGLVPAPIPRLPHV